MGAETRATLRRRLFLALGVGALYAALALGAIVASGPSGAISEQRSEADQNRYHLPTIRNFATGWPRVDVSDYLSATTPGYHLLLAGVGELLGGGTTTYRAVGALFGVGLAVLLTWLVMARTGSAPLTVALAAPTLVSLYVFASAVWLLPDNAGWLGALGVFALALRGRWGAGSLLALSALFVATIFVRQSHVWIAAAPLCAAWVCGEKSEGEAWTGIVPRNRTAWRARFGRAALVALALAPGFILLAWFAQLWGGLTPPTFQANVQRVNLATPGLALWVAGVYGVFFLPLCAGALRAAKERARVFALAGWCAVGGGLGAAVGVATHSTYDVAAGRYSGAWNVMDKLLIDVAGRSPVFALGAALGGAVLALVLACLPPRRRWVYGVSLLALAVGMTVNANAWQRYTEPFILMALALMAAEIMALRGDGVGARVGRARGGVWGMSEVWGSWGGPAALAALLAALTLLKIT